MGTFHEGLGDLHGITVVVQTRDNWIYAGRCHEARDDLVHMMKVDSCPLDSTNPDAHREWLRKIAKWGVFPKERVVKIPGDRVHRIIPLGEINSENLKSF